MIVDGNGVLSPLHYEGILELELVGSSRSLCDLTVVLEFANIAPVIEIKLIMVHFKVIYFEGNHLLL